MFLYGPYFVPIRVTPPIDPRPISPAGYPGATTFLFGSWLNQGRIPLQIRRRRCT